MSGTARPEHAAAPDATLLDEEQVTAIVRALARELGGACAASAATPTSSLERDVGLGSLERVELLTRIEEATGRELSDRFLLMDSARDIARALPSARVATLPAPIAESGSAASEERQQLEREAVTRTAEAPGGPQDAVPVGAPDVVPTTPSGKVRRGGVRAAYVAYLVAAWTIAALLLVPPLWVLSHLSPRGERVRRLTRLACRVALRITGCRVRVEGAARVPRAGAVVFVANHTSYVDTPALVASLPRDFVFVAMEEILGWPLIGGFVRRGLHPTVDRWHPRRSIADAAAIQARLAAGEAVLFFPEGGFGPASGLRPFRLGAFEAALASGAPVVPIALRGSRRVLPAGARLPRPGRVEIWIGEPLRGEGDDWRVTLALRERAADAIAAHSGEPRLEPAPGAVPPRTVHDWHDERAAWLPNEPHDLQEPA